MTVKHTTQEIEAAFRKELAALLTKWDADLQVEIVRGDAKVKIEACIGPQWYNGALMRDIVYIDLGTYIDGLIDGEME